MAPTKPRAGPSKGKKSSGKPSTNGAVSKSNKKPSAFKPSTQVKTKPASAPPKKKKKKSVYTDKELGIPKLNMITPAGVQKPKGQKKGKVFVDDQESMMTILAMVNADKEGQIESKMMKARHMEAIREARKKEAEARQEEKRSKLEETKDALRKKRKHKSGALAVPADDAEEATTNPKAKKKRVSFG